MGVGGGGEVEGEVKAGSGVAGTAGLPLNLPYDIVRYHALEAIPEVCNFNVVAFQCFYLSN